MDKDLGHAFFSTANRKKEQKQFVFTSTWDEQQYSFIGLPRTMLIFHTLSECSLERSWLSRHPTECHIGALHHRHLGFTDALSTVHAYGCIGDPIEIVEE